MTVILVTWLPSALAAPPACPANVKLSADGWPENPMDLIQCCRLLETGFSVEYMNLPSPQAAVARPSPNPVGMVIPVIGIDKSRGGGEASCCYLRHEVKHVKQFRQVSGFCEANHLSLPTRSNIEEGNRYVDSYQACVYCAVTSCRTQLEIEAYGLECRSPEASCDGETVTNQCGMLQKNCSALATPEIDYSIGSGYLCGSWRPDCNDLAAAPEQFCSGVPDGQPAIDG